jgi:hypothetical protein
MLLLSVPCHLFPSVGAYYQLRAHRRDGIFGHIFYPTDAFGVVNPPPRYPVVLPVSAQRHSIGADQIAIIDLERSWRKTLRDMAVLSPMTLVTYSLLWHELSQLALPSYLENDGNSDDDIKLYTDREFHRLLHRVEDRVKRQHICAISINQAQHLDPLALEWLLHLYRSCDEQFGLILCAQLKLGESRDEPLQHLFQDVPEARKARTDALVIKPLDEEEFRFKVMLNILKGLKANLAPEMRPKHLEFTEQWWQRTRGNWHSIIRLAKFFDWALSPDQRCPRLMTEEVVDQVYQRLSVVSRTGNTQ